MKREKDEQYALEIYTHIMDGFTDEHEQKWDLNEIDATAWFTGLVKASAMVFNKFTGNEQRFIEWTHTCQNLLIQNMMEKRKAL